MVKNLGYKIGSWGRWLLHHPTAMVTSIGMAVIILGGSTWLIYQATRSVTVLENWSITASNAREFKVVNGQRYPVYRPGDSFVFTSRSDKLIDAEGVVARSIVCDPTEEHPLREIQLDTVPAARPAGNNPASDSAIVIPDVAKFEQLPRICRLVINITYPDVALYRSSAGRTMTDPFIVEETVLDSKAVRNRISELTNSIKDLQSQLTTLEDEN